MKKLTLISLLTFSFLALFAVVTTAQNGDIEGKLRVDSIQIQDGGEAAGRVLTSDTNGNGTWQDAAGGGEWIPDANGIHYPNGNIAVNALSTDRNKIYAISDLGQNGPDTSVIYAYRQGTSGSAAEGGTGWGLGGVDAGIKSFSNWGNNYSAAIYGAGYLDYPNSASIFGGNISGSLFGALAFKDTLNRIWAGYFNGGVFTDGLTLQNGSQTNGAVLVSDAQGNASWQSPATLAITHPWTQTSEDLRLTEDSLNVMVSYYGQAASAKLHVNHSTSTGDHEAGLRVQINGSTKLALQNNGGLDVGGFSTSGNAPNNGLYVSGAVLIGTSVGKPGYELSVDGQIVGEEILVENSTNWPDYVFKDDYYLRSLDEVETHIKEAGHLPGIPSAAVVESEGILLGEMQKKTIEKIEELTLYMIQANKDIQQLKAENEILRKEVEALKQ